MEKDIYLAQAAWVEMSVLERARFLEWIARETGSDFGYDGSSTVKLIGEINLD